MEPLLYMLAGGALVLAGFFIGRPRAEKPVLFEKREPSIPADAPEDDMSIRQQVNRMMAYTGREQKGGAE